jgi:hypothetical protein
MMSTNFAWLLSILIALFGPSKFGPAGSKPFYGKKIDVNSQIQSVYVLFHAKLFYQRLLTKTQKPKFTRYAIKLAIATDRCICTSMTAQAMANTVNVKFFCPYCVVELVSDLLDYLTDLGTNQTCFIISISY